VRSPFRCCDPGLDRLSPTIDDIPADSEMIGEWKGEADDRSRASSLSRTDPSQQPKRLSLRSTKLASRAKAVFVPKLERPPRDSVLARLASRAQHGETAVRADENGMSYLQVGGKAI
jgi:hypothetical protein